MIIKVPLKEKDIHAEALINLGYKHRFFTIENNQLMLQCEVDDMPEACVYHFGRTIQLMVEMEQGKQRLKKFPYNFL